MRCWVVLLLPVAVALGGCPVAVTDTYSLAAEETNAGQGGGGACFDSELNGDESDTDCGGTECPPCLVGGICELPSDCASRSCSSGQCQAPTCVDRIRNGDETDLDCGGPDCPRCLAGNACKVNEDCATSACRADLCV